jgi:hypothetical protein
VKKVKTTAAPRGASSNRDNGGCGKLAGATVSAEEASTDADVAGAVGGADGGWDAAVASAVAASLGALRERRGRAARCGDERRGGADGAPACRARGQGRRDEGGGTADGRAEGRQQARRWAPRCGWVRRRAAGWVR